MNTPMMWMAGGAVSGAFFWSNIGPSFIEAIWLTSASIIMLARLKNNHLKIIIALIGFGLPGINMPYAAHTPSTDKHIVGTVIERQKYSALVRTKQGLIWTKIKSPPPVGTQLTARLLLDVYPEVLPGAYSTANMRTRLGIPPARTISWAPIDHSFTPIDILPAKHAGVIHALATGNRSRVDETVLNKMRRTGTVHLLAISGLHVGMAATVGWALGWLLSRPLVYWPSIARLAPVVFALGLAGHYGSLVGWPISTRRAFCMVVVVSLSRLIYRSIQPWHVWALALVVVITLQPYQAASIGFWMSFGAVAALIGWTTQWTTFSRQWPSTMRWAWNSLCASTAATIGVLPISAWVFQQTSVGAPIANLVAIPLFAGVAVPAAMMATYGPEETQHFWTYLADTSIDWGLLWMDWTDWGTWHPAVGPLGALMLAGAVMMHRFPRWALLLGTIAFIRPEVHGTNLEVSFPNVGQGSAALVAWPDGRKWLIDGGPPGKDLLHWLRRKGIRRLDAVFLSHPDTDHFGGLIPVFKSLPVETFWASRKPNKDERAFHNLWRDAAIQGTTLRIVGHGHTGNDNENSLVLRLRHGKHQFLLTGDIGVDTEENMLPHLEKFTVVQVPHHGSLGSSSEAFVKQTAPDFAVIQAGKRNRYKHPHRSVVERWGPKKVLRTDIDGTIRIRSNGEELKVDHENMCQTW